MSAPDTNIEKQAERHKGPLSGMPGAIILASVLFLGILGWFAMTDNEPREASVPAAGAAVETEPLN